MPANHFTQLGNKHLHGTFSLVQLCNKLLHIIHPL